MALPSASPDNLPPSIPTSPIPSHTHHHPTGLSLRPLSLSPEELLSTTNSELPTPVSIPLANPFRLSGLKSAHLRLHLIQCTLDIICFHGSGPSLGRVCQALRSMYRKLTGSLDALRTLVTHHQLLPPLRKLRVLPLGTFSVQLKTMGMDGLPLWTCGSRSCGD